MYKTVRHGENSLQYTILPQQDVDQSGNHSRRRRRSRTTTAVVAILVLGSAAVAASIALPLLVSADIVRVPESLRRFSPFATAPRPPPPTAATPTDLTTSEDNLNTLTTLPVVAAAGNRTEDAAEEAALQGSNSPPGPTATTPQMTAELELATSPARWGADADPGTPRPAGNPSTKIFAETMVPEVGAAGGRSASDTASTPTAPAGSTTRMTTTITTTFDPNVHHIVRPTGDAKRRGVYQPRWQPRWPFADPSAYFQWTGYAGRDSLILPLILGAVTLLLLLAVCACYAVKRRRQKTQRRKTIGKISSDLQSGDKATLLPDGSEEE